MYYVNQLITSDLFWPRLVQKRPEALWAFSASVNIFPSLMSNPLAFDFLLPLMHLPNDFLLLAMLLLAKFYLLYWLFCVCSHLVLLDDASVLTLWKPDLLSLCFLFFWTHNSAGLVASYPSSISYAMGSPGTDLPVTPSYQQLTLFAYKVKKASAWLGVGMEKWRGGEDFENGDLT